MTGYVEATRQDDDEKNRLCPPTTYPNSLAEWARMTVLGTQAVMSFTAEPDIKEWSDQRGAQPCTGPARTIRDRRRWTTPASVWRRTLGPGWPGSPS